MPRIVEIKDQSPLLVRPEDTVNGIVAVCRCGLSANWPYCNGSHKATAGEEADRVYHYDQELPQGKPQRHEVEWSAIKDGFHAKEGSTPARTAEADGTHHGAGTTPTRPPRPAPTRGDDTAETTGPPEVAPPEGPSQGI